MLHEVKGNPLEMNGKLDILSRETETIKKSQMEILEMNNTTSEIKDSLVGCNSRIEMAEEKVSELEYRAREIIQSKEHREKNIKNLKMSRMSAICVTISKSKTFVLLEHQREERGCCRKIYLKK